VRRRLMILLCSWAAASACQTDKKPTIFDEDVGDVAVQGGGSDDADVFCAVHEDCPEDFLCVDGVCVDRDTALADCQENDDCPYGFVCVDQDHCEEE
jgi:hypothetical protein